MASLSELLYDIKRISEHRKELTDKKIRKIYQSLSKSLDAFIADGYKKYADEEGRFYVSSLDAQNKKALFLREIAENVNSIAPEIKKEIMTLVDDTYSKSYQGMMNAFKKADTSEKFEEATKDIGLWEPCAPNPTRVPRSCGVCLPPSLPSPCVWLTISPQRLNFTGVPFTCAHSL